MSELSDKIAELIRPVVDYAATLDNSPLVQKVLTTALSQEGKDIVLALISDLEMLESNAAQDKEDAVAAARMEPGMPAASEVPEPQQ
jgi:hypothetical protein